MNNRLYINVSAARGRGVYAATSFSKDDLLEICPIIILSKVDRGIIHKTTLHDYYFSWGETLEEAAIALGYGSLYNHSSTPNAEISLDLNKETIDIIAISDIALGEEITIDYHAGLIQSDLWFEVH